MRENKVNEMEELLKAYNEQTPNNEEEKHSHVDYGDSYADSACC